MSDLPVVAGRYECVERLGGNMAAVYRAVDRATAASIVVKIPNGTDARLLARFRKEANILCRTRHPNIVAGLDAGEWNSQPYLAMEFMEGATLKQLLEQGAFSPDERGAACWIAVQIARGLRHLHARDIVHRDVKPDNIRVDADWNARLLDLGIARTAGSALTQAKEVMGTPKYMAPEQVLGQNVDRQSDIYSFGVVLYEMLTGQVPYRTQQAVELKFYLTIINSPPRSEPLTEAGAPPPLKDLVMRCLAKDKAARFATFEDVLDALEPLVPPSLLAPEPRPAPQPRRRSILWWAAAGFAAGAAAVTSYMLWREHAIASGEMALIPAGTAVIGTAKQRIYVKAFYLDKAEVSNAQFRRFCDATGHPRPRRLDAGDMPVVYVTFDDARAYARWAGKRLPTAVEWEYAVRGTSGRAFPWGNTPYRKRANLSAQMMKVTSLDAGASPEGVLHLIGNAWEWVEGPEVRGGGAAFDLISMQPVRLPPASRLAYLGFRCAKDA